MSLNHDVFWADPTLGRRCYESVKIETTDRAWTCPRCRWLLAWRIVHPFTATDMAREARVTAAVHLVEHEAPRQRLRAK